MNLRKALCVTAIFQEGLVTFVTKIIHNFWKSYFGNIYKFWGYKQRRQFEKFLIKQRNWHMGEV